MKELSIEQKAARYDEAIERARNHYDRDGLTLEQYETIDIIFPELKEDKNEKVRETLIKYFKERQKGADYDELFCGLTYYDILDWLKHDIDIPEATKQKLEDNLNKALEKETPKSWNKFLDGQGEQNAIEPDDLIEESYQQQADDLIDMVTENPAWSEEDERLRTSCIKHIEEELREIRNDKYGHSEIISDLKESCRERITWLKSLKERYTWKPSNKQMKAIEHICDGCFNVDLDILDSIYKDFKKLREE